MKVQRSQKRYAGGHPGNSFNTSRECQIDNQGAGYWKTQAEYSINKFFHKKTPFKSSDIIIVLENT